jgi:HD-GYP domain-containing protein (c-di-GMP phosphodiesterase class II)
MIVQEQGTRVCKHCGTPIQGNSYIEKGAGIYLGPECYFRDTYLDGIVSGFESSYLATIEAFVSAVDAREHETGNHLFRVSRLAIILGHAMGLEGQELADLYAGAILHDLGKIGVPDAILLKKGPLTPEEQQVMHQHPGTGHGIIGHIGYLAKAAEIVWSHHEHFDGSGYPRGLKDGDIPKGARIFSVADALDALTFKRPYREVLSFEEAKQEIGKDSGTIFDPAVVKALESVLEEITDFIGETTGHSGL